MQSTWKKATGIACGCVAGIAGLATLYRFPPDRYPVYPSCPFHALTGLLCPGCGSTRALAALVHGHLAEAWHWNALFVLLLPLAAGWLTVALSRSARGEAWPTPKPALICLLLGAATLFTVARNWSQQERDVLTKRRSMESALQLILSARVGGR